MYVFAALVAVAGIAHGHNPVFNDCHNDRMETIDDGLDGVSGVVYFYNGGPKHACGASISADYLPKTQLIFPPYVSKMRFTVKCGNASFALDVSSKGRAETCEPFTQTSYRDVGNVSELVGACPGVQLSTDDTRAWAVANDGSEEIDTDVMVSIVSITLKLQEIWQSPDSSMEPWGSVILIFMLVLVVSSICLCVAYQSHYRYTGTLTLFELYVLFWTSVAFFLYAVYTVHFGVEACGSDKAGIWFGMFALLGGFVPAGIALVVVVLNAYDRIARWFLPWLAAVFVCMAVAWLFIGSGGFYVGSLGYFVLAVAILCRHCIYREATWAYTRFPSADEFRRHGETAM